MLRVGFALLLVPIMGAQSITGGQSIKEAAAQLAARTSSLLPRHATVSLEVQSLTPLPAGWSSFRSLLQDELRKTGLDMVGTTADSRVRVTLSDSARGLLFVAEVISGDNRQVAMLPWTPPSSAQTKPRLSITKKVLWTQPEPILDILLLPGSDSLMMILSANKIASYRLTADNWTPIATVSLLLPRPLPRDPRGRLETTADGFRAYLPGATCSGVTEPQLKLICMPGNENWANTGVRWVADRNLLESDALRIPFYTTADDFFAMPGGRVQDRSGQPVAGSEGWGSDIAAIENPCAGSQSALVIATNGSTDRDEVRVFEIANGQASTPSDAMSLPGPATALWPSESRGQATLVVRNQQTGEYEASRLGLACSQ